MQIPSSSRHRFRVLFFDVDNLITPSLDERVTAAIASIARQESVIVSVAGITRTRDTLTILCEYWTQRQDIPEQGKDAPL